MGYFTESGRYADTEELVLNPSGPLSADENTAAVELGDRATVRLTLDVTAVDSALDVDIETSEDGSTWRVAGSFTQATEVTSERKIFTVDRFVRAAYDVTGNATCTLRGEAV